MSESMCCEICGGEIEGVPFTVVALTDPPRPVDICESCAAGQYVRLRIDETDLKIDRDDYLRADHDDLHEALAQAYNALADFGWKLEQLKISAS